MAWKRNGTQGRVEGGFTSCLMWKEVGPGFATIIMVSPGDSSLPRICCTRSLTTALGLKRYGSSRPSICLSSGGVPGP